jgi:hypothetical protein
MEQSIEEGTTAAIIINVIGEDGNHVAATIDTTTTRLSTHASAVPVVTQRDVGVYLIKWTGLSPALSPSDNDNGVSVEVNGTISGTAWTSYHIPVKILRRTLADGDIDGYNLEETLKLCLSALAGKVSGAGTTDITIRSADDSADRIVATVDTDGNRSSITLNANG